MTFLRRQEECAIDPFTSDTVLRRCETALRVDGATDAGTRVYSPGDWPSQQATLPQIKLRIARESRVSLGRSGAPQFTTTATIRILVEAQAFAEADDAGAAKAQDYAWRMKRQVEVAIINSYPLFREIQQLASMRSDLAYNADGATHIAGIQMDLDFEFYEGPESFAPIAASTISDVLISPTNYAPASVDVVMREPPCS
ncbi:hypothetical protein [Novosphingobium sp. FSW06-99]|uniref:hypothetical protein n=1 Tax=Novosphingobium sp. FSW06-99 TaxID=1739113 RepID=UPI00076D9988|nr:hypothetical protein [Novosphingobium sp. FSW06-99]KUR80761.1 hypothetical protein AQZ49_01660 [Novosphingobium sp. FSW06-99]